MRYSSFLFFFALISSLSAGAGWEKIASNEFEMKSPPASGSATHKKDFQDLHYWQDERNSKQCALGAQQTFPTVLAFFGPSAGQLTDREYRKASPLLNRVFKFTSRVSSYFKRQYERPRPYVTDPTLHPCIAPPGLTKSYPSSHSSLAVIGACVLGELFPSKADSLMEYGKSLGELRVIVGVHHPSDVKAGQKLGLDICERLLLEKDFRNELED